MGLTILRVGQVSAAILFFIIFRSSFWSTDAKTHRLTSSLLKLILHTPLIPKFHVGQSSFLSSLISRRPLTPFASSVVPFIFVLRVSSAYAQKQGRCSAWQK